MRRLAGYSALLALPVFLASCGRSGIEGTYSCTNMGLIDGIRLESGGKVTATANFGGSKMENSGMYRVQGDEVSITIAGDTETFKLSGGVLKDDTGGVCTRN